MPDAQKGHKSWIERLDPSPDADARDSSSPESGAAATPVSERGGDAESGATTWHEYLDASPEPTPASSRRPDSGSNSREPGQRQQPVPDPNVTELQRRWLFTQAQLLDDPREAVLEAGRLIGDAMRLASATVDEQRNRIERDWKTDADVDTDELRSVMQGYRSLFQYVLAADGLVDEVEAVRRERTTTTASQSDASTSIGAAPAQDGLAEVLQPGRALRLEAEALDRERSRPVQKLATLVASWGRGRQTRWVVGAALLLLVGLPAAYGWWRWQQPSSEGTARQARALTVEPLRYIWHEQGTRSPATLLDQEPGDRVGEGLVAGPGSPAEAAQAQQREATRPPAREPNPTVQEPIQARQSSGELVRIQQAVRSESEGATPVRQTAAAPAFETASLADDETPETEPETLAAETETALQGPAQTPVDVATVPAQQATSPLLQSADLSQIQPVAVEPEPRRAETAGAPATAEEDAPSEPQREVSEPATRPGDLVQLSDPGVARPALVVAPRADYPTAAQRLRREAVVELRVLVDERGMPTQIQPAGQSAGLGFDEAARMAVERARWRPATKDGVPVKVWIQTAVRFQLDGR